MGTFHTIWCRSFKTASPKTDLQPVRKCCVGSAVAPSSFLFFRSSFPTWMELKLDFLKLWEDMSSNIITQAETKATWGHIHMNVVQFLFTKKKKLKQTKVHHYKTCENIHSGQMCLGGSEDINTGRRSSGQISRRWTSVHSPTSC